MADRSNSPSQLERDVAMRRERLQRDLNELQARLSPGQLLDEGMTYLRRSQGADFFRNLGTSVKDRPLPVALVGIGLTWLAASSAGPTRYARPTQSDEPSLASRAWEAGRAVVQNAGETQAAYRERVLQARAHMLGMTQQAGEAADAYRERVEEALYSARDTARAVRDKVTATASDSYNRVTGAASDGYARAQDYAGRAGDTASRAAGSIGRTGSDLAQAVGDNPILLGALGMVAGALLGAVIPRSRTEEEMLQPVARNAAETTRGLASQVMEHGERVARAAMDAGTEAVQKVADAGSEAVRQATETGAEAGTQHSASTGNTPAQPAPDERDRMRAEPAGPAVVSPIRRTPDRVPTSPGSGLSRAPLGDPSVERERERQVAGSTPLPGTNRTGDSGSSPMVG